MVFVLYTYFINLLSRKIPMNGRLKSVQKYFYEFIKLTLKKCAMESFKKRSEKILEKSPDTSVSYTIYYFPD